MAAASLVLGIISLVLTVIPATHWLGAVLGLIGIILGVQGRKNPEKRGLATGGMVCSIIGFVCCIIGAIACAACTSGLACAGGELFKDLL